MRSEGNCGNGEPRGQRTPPHVKEPVLGPSGPAGTAEVRRPMDITISREMTETNPVSMYDLINQPPPKTPGQIAEECMERGGVWTTLGDARTLAADWRLKQQALKRVNLLIEAIEADPSATVVSHEEYLMGELVAAPILAVPLSELKTALAVPHG